jgi:hypothetical protein
LNEGLGCYLGRTRVATLSRSHTFKVDSYQYHLLGMGIETEVPAEYIHCQITTLSSESLVLALMTARAYFGKNHLA